MDGKTKTRKDALTKFYFRALKKIPYFLIEKGTPKNKYKQRKASEFLVAFLESHSSFLFSINKFEENRLVESFIEYIVIYFPVNKAHSLIETLIKQNAGCLDFLKNQQDNLEKREAGSKQNIMRWAATSQIFSDILRLSLDVLSEPEFRTTASGAHLIQITEECLNAQADI